MVGSAFILPLPLPFDEDDDLLDAAPETSLMVVRGLCEPNMSFEGSETEEEEGAPKAGEVEEGREPKGLTAKAEAAVEVMVVELLFMEGLMMGAELNAERRSRSHRRRRAAKPREVVLLLLNERPQQLHVMSPFLILLASSLEME